MLYSIIVFLVEKKRLFQFRFALLKSNLLGIEKPIVVYQMGKVGSSSIIYSLAKKKEVSSKCIGLTTKIYKLCEGELTRRANGGGWRSRDYTWESNGKRVISWISL